MLVCFVLFFFRSKFFFFEENKSVNIRRLVYIRVLVGIIKVRKEFLRIKLCELCCIYEYYFEKVLKFLKCI